MPEQFSGITAFLPLILVVGLLYFMMIRPQQAQQRKRQEMLSSLKRGDKVVTIGGIHGTITVIADDIVRLEIGENMEMQLNKSGIGYVKEDEPS